MIDAIASFPVGVLTAGCALGLAALIPYLHGMAAFLPLKPGRNAPPLWKLALGAGVNLLVVFVPAILLGLWAANAVGLGAPVLAALSKGQVPADWARLVAVAGMAGMAAGGIVAALDRALFRNALPLPLRIAAAMPLWRRLLAGIAYGGINEEVLTRLFLVSGLAWLIGLAWEGPAGMPAQGAYALAIGLAALAFALLHLPATAVLTSLTPRLVLRAIVLNGIPGIVFGWLYWRFGLEAAMLAHAASHLVLQSIPD